MVNILLIRHAETIHNAQGCWAGHLDSPLTTHGAAQAAHLGPHLTSLFPYITHIFISPLSRTQHTANSIFTCLPPPSPTVVTTAAIIERDFGRVDGLPWSNTPDPSEIERISDVERRADEFLDEHLISVIQDAADKQDALVIVSHGAFLPVLWDRLKARYPSEAKGWNPVVDKARWKNTAYMHIRVDPDTESVEVVTKPCTDHLKDLKRTKGGIGSAQWDPKQRPLESFWKQREAEGEGRGESPAKMEQGKI